MRLILSHGVTFVLKWDKQKGWFCQELLISLELVKYFDHQMLTFNFDIFSENSIYYNIYRITKHPLDNFETKHTYVSGHAVAEPFHHLMFDITTKLQQVVYNCINSII